MGLKYAKNMHPAAGGAQVWRATTEKVVYFCLEKKCTLAASVAPNVKSWLRACLNPVVNKHICFLNEVYYKTSIFVEHYRRIFYYR